MKIIKCKYCGKEFETDGSRKMAGIITAHMRTCDKNPNKQKNIEAQKRGSRTMNKKHANKIHQQKIQNELTRKKRDFVCIKCGNTYQLELTDKEYEIVCKNPMSHPFRKHCSLHCANSGRTLSKEHKEKIKNSLNKYYSLEYAQANDKKIKKVKTYICKHCGKNYTRNESKIRGYCSQQCKDQRKKQPRIISEETRRKLSEAGKRSAAKMSALRRSKNEIYFCELCEKEFKNVGHNKSIFNGWDADVLLYDYKIAVLWNGKWHYVEIMKKKNTLKRIQNRDKIKINEIQKAGWFPYVIKDMGKYNLAFVEEQFKVFKNFIAEQTRSQSQRAHNPSLNNI